jgi:transglutaminase-like putative cysteine protease
LYIGRSSAPLGECHAIPVKQDARQQVVLAGLPPGDGATKATLRVMRDFVKESVRNPDQIVRKKAESLVLYLPARQWFQEIKACHEFVRDQIRYLRDPVDLERVATPEITLEMLQGDCDDKSTLLAALLHSIGHPVRFVAVGMNGEPFSHVLVETKIRNTGNDKRDWMPLETILPKPAGWWPDGVTSTYRLKV